MVRHFESAELVTSYPLGCDGRVRSGAIPADPCIVSGTTQVGCVVTATGSMTLGPKAIGGVVLVGRGELNGVLGRNPVDAKSLSGHFRPDYKVF